MSPAGAADEETRPPLLYPGASRPSKPRCGAGPPTNLGDLPAENSLDRPGDHGSIVSSISDDGNIIIGHSGLAPLRWTPATGFAPLPFDERLGAPAEIVPTDLTGDGSLLVGWASEDRGETSSAVLWERGDRMWLLDTLLPQLGFDLDGWSLTRAIAISGDGRYIVGDGIHDGLYESYLLDFRPDGFTPIPEPSSALESRRRFCL